MTHYRQKIQENENWIFAGIFADEGLSGRSAKKRPEFMKMIELCKKGKIDVILTKSISRFSRNTQDSLNYMRLLKNMGIAIIFEKEGINTLEMANELLFSLMGSFAQAKNESHSLNVTWGKQKAFAQGTYHFSFKYFLGYEKGENGVPKIIPEEAKIIKDIFYTYLRGKCERDIKKHLEYQGYLTPKKKDSWAVSTIQSIL